MGAIAHRDHDCYADVPRSIRRHAAFGLLLLLVSFGGFGAWAFLAPLAAAVIAQGSFVATGQNNTVQHLEGGIIKDIMVAEGDNVRVGQPLIKLDETAAMANERQLMLRLARLEAINARLAAEQQLSEELVFPNFLTFQERNSEIAEILRSQRDNFQVSKRKLDSDMSLLRSNIRSLEFRAQGYQLQRESMMAQLELLRAEREDKLTLLRQGFIRRTETNAIERAIADAEGQVGRLEAEVNETNAQIEKLRQQMDQTRAAYKQAAVDELQSIEAELDAVREQSRNAENILRRSLITAPVDGTIVRMHYNTPGGVIESGKPIIEILPTEVPLIIETLVPRTDIDSVRIGQKAIVRMVALNQRTTPVLNGTVDYVSADSLPDNANGVPREVYVSRISVPASELSRIAGFSPTPGMPVEIMIQTAERTFFSYISQPIVDSMTRAFREN